jgi:hypothetical protein
LVNFARLFFLRGTLVNVFETDSVLIGMDDVVD